MSLLPEYENAVHECWQEGMDIIMRASDPVLGGMPPMVRTPHVPVSGTSPETSIGYHGALQPIESKVEFDVMAFLNLDLSAWDTAVAKCAESSLPQVMKIIFDTFEAATRQSGNVADAAGRALSWDVLLYGLEKIELDFDEDGQHKKLTFVVPEGADKALQPMTEAQTQRYHQIVEQKRAQFLARRRVRKLDK